MPVKLYLSFNTNKLLVFLCSAHGSNGLLFTGNTLHSKEKKQIGIMNFNLETLNFSVFAEPKSRRVECGHFVFLRFYIFTAFCMFDTYLPKLLPHLLLFLLKWRVRKEAMMGLAQLYKKYCLHAEAGKDAAEKVSWIKDKLLHIYYQNSIDDKWVNLSLPNFNCTVIWDALKMKKCSYHEKAVILHSVRMGLCILN